MCIRDSLRGVQLGITHASRQLAPEADHNASPAPANDLPGIREGGTGVVVGRDVRRLVKHLERAETVEAEGALLPAGLAEGSQIVSAAAVDHGIGVQDTQALGVGARCVVPTAELASPLPGENRGRHVARGGFPIGGRRLNREAAGSPVARVLFLFVGRTLSVDGETYLLMPEVQASDLADEDLARELVPRKSVALSSVRKYLQQTGAREVVLIVNSCGNRSGATITQTTTTSTGGTQTPGGVTTILASLTGDSSFEVEGKRRGLFGWTLSRELRGVADLDRNGAVTLQELTTKLSTDLSSEATQRGLTLGQSVTVTTEGALNPARLLLTAFPAGK